MPPATVIAIVTAIQGSATAAVAAVSAPAGAPARASRRRTVRPSRACSEAPLAAAEGAQRVGEGVAAEVGPELVAEDDLRVGALPEQVVGGALLAAGADQEVWIVHLGRVQVAAELLLGVPLEVSRRVDDLR